MMVEPTAAPEPTKAPEQPPESKIEPTPPPVNCDPANPMLTPVTVLTGPMIGPYGNEIYTMEATYSNPKLGQEFLLTVSSGDRDALMTVVKNLQVCYEALDSGTPAPTPAPSGGESDTIETSDLEQTIVFLKANPYNTLFEFQLTKGDVKWENIVAVNFVIDPTLDNDRVDDFRAKCAFSAFISVGVKSNNAQAELFLAGQPAGRTNVVTAGATPTPVSHNNGNVRTTYDARVYGPSGTKHWVSGAWWKAGSTISTRICPYK